jgi:beta-glucosidase
MEAGRTYRLRVVSCRKQDGSFLQFGYRLLRGTVEVGGTLARAVAAAREADAVVFCGGLSHLDDTEGGDRFDLRLPSRQDDAIKALAEANPNLVVVLLGSGCVEMPWLDRVKAVVQAWYPGQEGGHALAEVLCGDVSPSGRLPVSWPRCLADTPVARYGDYAAGQETYREGLMVGYRHYDTNAVAPLFPFGHGLSYTEFAWSDMRVDQVKGTDGALMRVQCTVRNTGRRAGAEVVQCYVAACGSSVPRPVKELKAFQKIFLKPGESARVIMELDRRAFSYWAPSGGWVMEPGRYRILLAASAADVRMEQERMME